MDRNAPFQTFDDRSDAATCAPRLAALRAKLAKRGLDGFVVPHSDEYQSEYLPECNERLAWLTAFTGSAGAAVVLKDKAAVFADGRYTLQVREQTDTKLFDPRDLVEEGPERVAGGERAEGCEDRVRPVGAFRRQRRCVADVGRARGRDPWCRPTAIRSTRCGATAPPRRPQAPCRMR